MTTGINATITTLTDGTTAHAGDVMASLNSLNSNGVSNDGGNIQTDGSGNIIWAGKLGKSSVGDVMDATVNGGNDTVLKSRGTGSIDFQQGSSNVAQFTLASGTAALQLSDAGTFKPVVYVDAAHETILQMANNSGVKVFVKDAAGGALFSIDTSGNVRAKGTVTASVTP